MKAPDDKGQGRGTELGVVEPSPTKYETKSRPGKPRQSGDATGPGRVGGARDEGARKD